MTSRHMNHSLSCISIAALALFTWQTSRAQLTTPSTDDTRGAVLPQGLTVSGHPAMPGAITSANQRIGQIKLIAQSDSVIADGQSQVLIRAQVLGKDGQPMSDEVVLTLEATQGLINLQPGAPLKLVQDQQGRLLSQAEAADIDELTPGIQIKVRGSLEFSVIAPFELKDVQVRVTGGSASQTISIKALPELRDMVAAGVIEGQLRLNKLAKNLVPANEGDLFEREIKRVQQEFDNGQGTLGGRAAFFLKGKVKGDYLLTAAADSDKEIGSRLFKDIDPNAFYPVYGDSSLRGSDAQSSGRLFVRIDKERSYLLYGDFTSANTSEVLALGNTARSATGLKWHLEDLDSRYILNAFASYDTLTQVIDEIPGRGISGPYSVRTANGISGSERIDIIVRDRNQPSLILSTQSQVRQSDYEFEPFSGKILFKKPIPSVDENFNPVSIRVAYEVEQGGDQFWLLGANAKVQLNSALTVGAAFSSDNNPNQRYSLASLGLRAQIAQGISVSTEIARSDGTPGGVIGDKQGNAQRFSVDAQQGDFSGQLKWQRSQIGFDNPSAGLAGGRMEFNANARYALTPQDGLRAQLSRSQDMVTNAQRDSALIEYERTLTAELGLRVGLRHGKDSLGSAPSSVNLGSSSGICSNFSGYNGGFGIASGNGVIDSLCNNGSRSPVAAASLAAASPNVDSDSIFVRLSYQPRNLVAQAQNSTALTLQPSRWSLFGEAEVDVHDSDKRRLATGINYQWSERTKLYGRFEDISSVTGLNGLSRVDQAHQRAFALGVSSDYAENAQAYNEYRLSAAASGKQTENALGLRNTFLIAPGLKLSTNAELIKVLSGGGSDAAALGVGLDYTALADWKASGRLEWRQDNSSQNWLSTAKLARKLDDDWTLLAQNYLSVTRNRAAEGQKLENRFITGAAYRPLKTNLYNWLLRYELRNERDSLPASSQPQRQVNIISVHGDWHPKRVWHLNGRLALKSVDETFNAGSQVVNDRFSAWLIGSRVMYDLTDRWSVGAQLSMLTQTQGGKAVQFGYGLEAGYVVTSNLWLNVGYTWRGLKDKDLPATEYRNRGLFLGLRYKFDENIWSADNPRVNKSLESQ